MPLCVSGLTVCSGVYVRDVWCTVCGCVGGRRWAARAWDARGVGRGVGGRCRLDLDTGRCRSVGVSVVEARAKQTAVGWCECARRVGDSTRRERQGGKAGRRQRKEREQEKNERCSPSPRQRQQDKPVSQSPGSKGSVSVGLGGAGSHERLAVADCCWLVTRCWTQRQCVWAVEWATTE